MTFHVDDSHYLLLGCSCAVMFVMLTTALFQVDASSSDDKMHLQGHLVNFVFGLEAGFVGLLVWNTSIGQTYSALYVTNVFYVFIIVIIVGSIAVICLSNALGWAFGVGFLAALAFFVLFGRDKFKDWFQETFNDEASDLIVTLLFASALVVLFIGYWVFHKQKWLMQFIYVLMMSFSFSFALNILLQEVHSENDIDLLPFDSEGGWISFGATFIPYILIYYRPCLHCSPPIPRDEEDPKESQPLLVLPRDLPIYSPSLQQMTKPM